MVLTCMLSSQNKETRDDGVKKLLNIRKKGKVQTKLEKDQQTN